MSEEKDDLGYYLYELYKNLNIITDQLENSMPGEEFGENDLDEDVIVAMEERFTEWMGSFYNILIYLFCTTTAFLAAIINPGVRALPITMFVLFPLYLWFTFLYSIPDITINNQTIFSRRDLTIRKQITLARSLFEFFLRQLYDNSKHGLVIMASFLFFLAVVAINEYVTTVA